jgi:hypothetical protein
MLGMYMANATTATATLTYDATKELLQGTIGKESFSLTAYSGGSRGHSVSANSQVAKQQAKLYLHVESASPSSRFANTRTVGEGTKKDPYKQRGGTLPPGHYSCIYKANHPPFGECIYLKRQADTHFHYPTASGISLDNRGDDFYIHGHGPKGSDGCIVPQNNAVRLSLNKAIKNFPGQVILLVKNVAYVLPAERDDVAIA